MCSTFSIFDQLLVDDFTCNSKLMNDDIKTILSQDLNINSSAIENNKKENEMDFDSFEFKTDGPNAVWKNNYDWSDEDSGILDALLGDSPMDDLDENGSPTSSIKNATPDLDTPTLESLPYFKDESEQSELDMLNQFNDIEGFLKSENIAESQLSPSSSGYGSSSPEKDGSASDDFDIAVSSGSSSPDGGYITPTYTPESMLNDSPATEIIHPPSPQTELVQPINTIIKTSQSPTPTATLTPITRTISQPTRQVQFIRQPKSQQPSQQIILTTGRGTTSNISNIISTASINSSINNSTITTPTVLKTVTVPSGTLSGNGQTIVVTQGNRSGTYLRSGTTLLKTGSTNANGSRSLLLPVNQVGYGTKVKTIKIINQTPNVVNSRGLRTVVTDVRGPTGTVGVTPSVRTVVGPRSLETKGFVKVNPSNLVSASTLSSMTSIKEEPVQYSDDSNCNNDPNRELRLTEEEKKLLKKEKIPLPTHYPLSSDENKLLKKIRRKIRNKISAQDSRKRKKEYIDSLVDEVTKYNQENHELQKRIKTLESQNETLMAQVRRFQSVMTGGGRINNQTSTFLMVIILSTAFLFANFRSQDKASTEEAELSMPSKMPASGNSRSLLEAGTNLGTMDDDKDSIDVDSPTVRALSDHDYAPPSKRMKVGSGSMYIVPPLDDQPLKIQKNDPGGGIPPDRTMMDQLEELDRKVLESKWDKNYSDPGGFRAKSPQTVVVNLRRKSKVIVDDLELE